MASPPSPKKAKRRSWLRFSLRTFLILFTALGIWLGRTVNGVVNMRRSAGFVSEIGGEVYYHYELGPAERAKIRKQNQRRRFQGLPPIVVAAPEPAAPEWLRNLVGIDYFREVAEIQLSRSEVADNDLTRLRPFRRLKTLSFVNRKITDAGLEALPHFPQLETLRLQGTEITDAGLGHLAKFTSLEMLNVKGTVVTLEAINELQKQLPGTEILHSTK